MFGTETQFINSQIELWGEEDILSLIDRGYQPYLTERGWRWLLNKPHLTNDPARATLNRRVSPVSR